MLPSTPQLSTLAGEPLNDTAPTAPPPAADGARRATRAPDCVDDSTYTMSAKRWRLDGQACIITGGGDDVPYDEDFDSRHSARYAGSYARLGGDDEDGGGWEHLVVHKAADEVGCLGEDGPAAVVAALATFVDATTVQCMVPAATAAGRTRRLQAGPRCPKIKNK